MRKLAGILLLVLMCVSALAAPVLKISRVSSTDQRLNVVIQDAPLSSVMKALELHLSQPVLVDDAADRMISFRASRILPDTLMKTLVRNAGLDIESQAGWLVVRDPSEPTVTLDLKDAELTLILQEIKKQCGIRNLMIDPEVREHRGTFLFVEVPCTQALVTIFDSLGLTAEVEANSILTVENPR